MLSTIDSSFLNYEAVRLTNNIDSNMLNYSGFETKDPVQNIINSDISNCEKVELIDKLLVSKYKIIKGRMSRMLATISVGDSLLIGREESKVGKNKKKKRKALKKKKKKK